MRRLWERGHVSIIVAMLAGPVLGADLRNEPVERTPLNTMTGVVVSKEDGKPLSGVHVVLAHAERAFVSIGNEAEIWAYGPEDKVLFFFSRRNGKSVCEADTDENGRFTLRGFASPNAKHNLVVGHKDQGIAVVRNVVPAAHGDELLRVEIARPTYIEATASPLGRDRSRWQYVRAYENVQGTEPADENIRCNLYGFVTTPNDLAAEAESRDVRLGPLVSGESFRVGEYASIRGYTATVFQTTTRVESGKTVKVSLGSKEGTTLSGAITDTDGRALADVNVTVRPVERDDSDLVIGALTDEKGRYTLAGVPPGKYELGLLRHAVRTAPG